MKAEARIQLAFDPLVDDDGKMIIELFLLAPNIKKEVVGILNFFLTFLKIYEENKTYNILSLMLVQSLKVFVLCLLMLGVSKENLLWKNMMQKIISYAFEMLPLPYILWEKLNLVML
jgi:hypothetical protein